MSTNNTDPTVQTILAEQEQALSEIAKQFHQTTFMERMSILFNGLNAPKDSREYKLARIEVQRLTAPACAIVLPCLFIGTIVLFASTQAAPQQEWAVEVNEVEEVQELEKPPIEHIDNEMPECEFEFDIDLPTPVDQVIMDTVTAQPAEFDSVLPTKSPVMISQIYSSRNPGARGTMVGRFSRNAHGNATSVHIALRWLKKNQNVDGSWPRCKPAMTGLALLCFLSHGETPGASAEFGDTVQKAIEYLVYSYKNSRWEGSDGHEYAFPIALYALCEAYGMTSNPNIRPVVEDALKRMINGQHPSGGWDYNMKQSDRDDTSYMAWCAQALKAAQMARMFSNDPEWKQKLDRACKLSNNGFIKNSGQSGGFGYTGPGNSGFNGLGVLCMQFHGAANHPSARNTISLMDAWVPGWFANEAEWKASGMPGGVIHGHTGCPQYYYYYATQAKFHDSERRFKPWFEAIDAAYIKAQKVEKNAYPDHNGKLQDIGWWENPDQHTDDASRQMPVMDTCLAALQMMTPYRYLPTGKETAVNIDANILDAIANDANEVKLNIGNL